jgi:hypothetical protein
MEYQIDYSKEDKMDRMDNVQQRRDVHKNFLTVTLKEKDRIRKSAVLERKK